MLQCNEENVCQKRHEAARSATKQPTARQKPDESNRLNLLDEDPERWGDGKYPVKEK
jgi:hypothetical protein